MDKYIELEFAEAQFFMQGGEYPSENLHFDPVKNVWFVPESEYNKARNRDEVEFPITTVTRDDLQVKGFDTSEVSDEQMQRLASKMADDYIEQMFWISMDILAESMGIPKSK